MKLFADLKEKLAERRTRKRQLAAIREREIAQAERVRDIVKEMTGGSGDLDRDQYERFLKQREFRKRSAREMAESMASWQARVKEHTDEVDNLIKSVQSDPALAEVSHDPPPPNE